MVIDQVYNHAEDSVEDDFDVDSLFDSNSPTTERFPYSVALTSDATPIGVVTAQRTAPCIPGLYFDPSILISPALASELSDVAAGYFRGNTGAGSVNQVMLFGRASGTSSGLPSFLDNLVAALSPLLKPNLPAQVHEMLFPSPAFASRQAILNHYTPGEGITSHVDLLTRFADGIVAVSLGSGTVMTFRRIGDDELNSEGKRCDVYLPERSLLVLTGDARYKWSHGIEGRLEDCVENGQGTILMRRGTRISITLRWLLPGADVVGDVD